MPFLTAFLFPESKSGEELISNINSLLSSPSLDPFMSTAAAAAAASASAAHLLPPTSSTSAAAAAAVAAAAGTSAFMPSLDDQVTMKLLETTTLPYGTAASTAGVKDLTSASMMLGINISQMLP